MFILRSLSLLCILSAGRAAVNLRSVSSVAPASVCAKIAGAISSASSVYHPGSAQYGNDNFHTYGTSSQPSTCTVEPGKADDVGKILVILGATRTPFAVKSGGHAYNQNFSSTTGVLISMTRFNKTMFDPRTNTATVGSGLKWSAVYKALEKYSVAVVGARVPDVGVAGFTLGGGYSWHTNQYGLGADNVVAFELVLPCGDVVTVSETSHPDLFFGLRGGWNNFGIITRFTLRAFPQGQVWGGYMYHTGDHVEELNAAVLQFLKNNDPKAGLLFLYGYTTGTLITSALLFYDGPSPPLGIFDGFLATPGPIVNTVATQSFASYINAFPAQDPARAMHGTVPSLAYDEVYMKAMINETTFWGPRLSRVDPNITLGYVLEPFLPSILSHTRTPSAYPASRARALLPTTFEWTYVSPAADADVRDAMVATQKQLQRTVSGVNITDPDVVLYGNYALAPETRVEDIFGNNLPVLKALNRKYDPSGVMALTGGWKV